VSDGVVPSYRTALSPTPPRPMTHTEPDWGGLRLFCDRQLASFCHQMPRRSRSATPSERERRRSRSRSRSRSRERSYKLPEGVSEISESDYFLKSDEFRIWLKEEKDRASHSHHRSGTSIHGVAI